MRNQELFQRRRVLDPCGGQRSRDHGKRTWGGARVAPEGRWRVLPTMRPPSTAMPRVMARDSAWIPPCLDASRCPAATSGKTSAILKETRPRDLRPQPSRTRLDVWIRTRGSPVSVNVSGGQGGRHGSDHGAHDAGHAVQVVDAARVLDLQLLLEEGLKDTTRRPRRDRAVQASHRTAPTFAHREELEAEHGDDPRQEAHDHGAERRQHHLTRRSHGNATSQGRVLDVDLQQKSRWWAFILKGFIIKRTNNDNNNNNKQIITSSNRYNH